MLQTLNIPSSPLPEVPSAPPGTCGEAGDAGERAEFAQLLQQAKTVDSDGAHDAPTVQSAKESRVDPRARPVTARGTQEHKPHDMRYRADAETADAQAIDIAGSMKQLPLTDASAAPADEAKPAHEPHEPDHDATLAVADPVLPVVMQASEPAHATLPALPTATEDRGSSARLHARAAREMRDLRLPTRTEATTTAAAEASAAHPGPAGSDITVPNGRDGAFDLMLRQAAGGRGMSAPSFQPAPLDATPAAVAAFARELHQTPGAHAEAKAEATLHAAPDEVGFAPALGTQVALWVKDGVQEARLQLHPAELGPVTVQIALDGQAAHIDFTAAVAATRESIEQSLPSLAAALRESGFTLAGGGVFGGSGQGANDPARQRGPEGRGQGTRGTAAIGSADSAEAAARLPRRSGRSLLDVYA